MFKSVLIRGTIWSSRITRSFNSWNTAYEYPVKWKDEWTVNCIILQWLPGCSLCCYHLSFCSHLYDKDVKEKTFETNIYWIISIWLEKQKWSLIRPNEIWGSIHKHRPKAKILWVPSTTSNPPLHSAGAHVEETFSIVKLTFRICYSCTRRLCTRAFVSALFDGGRSGPVVVLFCLFLYRGCLILDLLVFEQINK